MRMLRITMSFWTRWDFLWRNTAFSQSSDIFGSIGDIVIWNVRMGFSILDSRWALILIWWHFGAKNIHVVEVLQAVFWYADRIGKLRRFCSSTLWGRYGSPGRRIIGDISILSCRMGLVFDLLDIFLLSIGCKTEAEIEGSGSTMLLTAWLFEAMLSDRLSLCSGSIFTGQISKGDILIGQLM